MILHNFTGKIHIIGIAGTGMSGLASLLLQKGFQVSGSDKAFYPPMGDYLRSLPVNLLEGYDAAHLGQIQPDLIIVGNAISRGNPELEAALIHRIPLLSFPEAMKFFFLMQSRNIVVTGTHGKTTTTSLIAHLLQAPGYEASFLVGGIPVNFGVPASFRNPHLFVIEGDEYDSCYFDKSPKFMKYLPYFLVINNIEFDHADIYSSLEDINRQFYYLSRLVPSNGLIVANGDDKNVREILQHPHSPVIFFGRNPENDVLFRIGRDSNRFILELQPDPYRYIFEMPFPMTGLGYNMTAASIIAHQLGLNPRTIADRMATFKGVRRRLEKVFERKNLVIFDDFAHHPTAVRVTLEAVRAKFPTHRLIAVFEPRSNTTIRKVFQQEYATAFSPADEVYLAPVFRKDHLSDNDYLNTSDLAAMIRKSGKFCLATGSHDELLSAVLTTLESGNPKCLVMMSNGSFDPFKTDLLKVIRDSSE